jgi:hypothetical protein
MISQPIDIFYKIGHQGTTDFGALIGTFIAFKVT